MPTKDYLVKSRRREVSVTFISEPISVKHF
jgi:hypothetical protein